MTIQVMRATTAQLEAVAELFDAYRGFYQQPSNLAQSRAFIAERMDGDESAIFLAQDENGGALGFVQLYPTFSSIDAHRTWLLSDLFTAPAARGRGVGRLLMNTARDFALQTGAKGWCWKPPPTTSPRRVCTSRWVMCAIRVITPTCSTCVRAD